MLRHGRRVCPRLVQLERNRTTHHAAANARRLSSTYYDSQSGMHIPIHNELEISLVFNKSKSVKDFVPSQLYKEDAYSDMPGILQNLREQQGILGIILPELKFPRDVRNMKTLLSISPPNFMYFVSSSTVAANSGLLPCSTKDKTNNSNSSKLSVVIDYDRSDDVDEDGYNDVLNATLRDDMQKHVANNVNTTLSIRVDDKTLDPMTIAVNVATTIDNVGGGCDFVWLRNCGSSPLSTNVDYVFMCLFEELSYLDLTGSIMKSRLMIDASLNNLDIVEEAMNLGANKFVIDNDNVVDKIEAIAHSQGKTILKL